MGPHLSKTEIGKCWLTNLILMFNMKSKLC